MHAGSWQQTLVAHFLDPLIDLLPYGGVAACKPFLVVWFLQCRDAAGADAVEDGVDRALWCRVLSGIVQGAPQCAERQRIPIFRQAAHGRRPAMRRRCGSLRRLAVMTQPPTSAARSQ